MTRTITCINRTLPVLWCVDAWGEKGRFLKDSHSPQGCFDGFRWGAPLDHRVQIPPCQGTGKVQLTQGGRCHGHGQAIRSMWSRKGLAGIFVDGKGPEAAGGASSPGGWVGGLAGAGKACSNSCQRCFSPPVGRRRERDGEPFISIPHPPYTGMRGCIPWRILKCQK